MFPRLHRSPALTSNDVNFDLADTSQARKRLAGFVHGGGRGSSGTLSGCPDINDPRPPAVRVFERFVSGKHIDHPLAPLAAALDCEQSII